MNKALTDASEYRYEALWRALEHERSAMWHRKWGVRLGAAATAVSAIVGSAVFVTATTKLGPDGKGMRRREAKQERKSFPATQNVQPKQPAVIEQPSPLPTTQNEPKRPTISEDDVRFRAYELYLQRGATPGNELTDWLQAERELRQGSRRSDA